MINESSYDYVKNQLLYLGFGEEIAAPLREKMESGETQFTLARPKEFGPDKTENTLHFSKGDDLEKDFTFFNRVDMTLKQAGKEDLTQTFFIGKEHNYTLQERYNMMAGRFVYREQPKVEPKEVNGEIKMVPTGETYTAWRGLNFKESDKHGNFLPKIMFWDHRKAARNCAIKELNDPYDQGRFFASIEKGNLTRATFLKDGQEIKGQVAANPRTQHYDFYDAKGQSIKVDQVKKQGLDKAEQFRQSETGEAKQEVKETRQQQVASVQNREIKRTRK